MIIRINHAFKYNSSLLSYASYSKFIQITSKQPTLTVVTEVDLFNAVSSLVTEAMKKQQRNK